MTRNDIIRMAQEAGLTSVIDAHHKEYGSGAFDLSLYEEVTRFAELVTAAKDAEHQQTLALQQRSYEREIQMEVEAEREACAKIVETHQCTGWGILSAAIRARGNA